jgi:hypothetical protein
MAKQSTPLLQASQQLEKVEALRQGFGRRRCGLR